MKKKVYDTVVIATFLLGISSGVVYANEVSKLSSSDQVKIIVANVEKWKPTKGGSYAITDLDGNGRMEVITSYLTRKRTQAIEVWEVNEEGKGIKACTFPWKEEEEQPEVIQKSMPVYYDSEQNRYYFIFGEEPKTVISLKEGDISCTVYNEEVCMNMEERQGTISWISTSEHPLDGAPMEQILELAGESSAAFSVKAAE